MWKGFLSLVDWAQRIQFLLVAGAAVAGLLTWLFSADVARDARLFLIIVASGLGAIVGLGIAILWKVSRPRLQPPPTLAIEADHPSLAVRAPIGAVSTWQGPLRVSVLPWHMDAEHEVVAQLDVENSTAEVVSACYGRVLQYRALPGTPEQVRLPEPLARLQWEGKRGTCDLAPHEHARLNLAWWGGSATDEPATVMAASGAFAGRLVAPTQRTFWTTTENGPKWPLLPGEYLADVEVCAEGAPVPATRIPVHVHYGGGHDLTAWEAPGSEAALLYAPNETALPSPLLLTCGNTQDFERFEHPNVSGYPPAWTRQVKLLKVTNNGSTAVKRCTAAIEVTAVPLAHTPLPVALTWDDGRTEKDMPAGGAAHIRLYWDEVRTATGNATDFPPSLATHSVPFTVTVRAPGYQAARRSYRLREVSQERTHPELRGRALGTPTITEIPLLPGPTD